MDEDEDDFMDSYVPVRPYSAECAAAGDHLQRDSKKFRPTLPTERRHVEQVLWSSACTEETVESMLADASRRQELEFGQRGREVQTPERYHGMSLKKFGVTSGGSAASAAALAKTVGGAAAPRKVKELKANRSMELMDLAFTSARRTVDGNIRTTYAPISLPYFNVAEEDEESYVLIQLPAVLPELLDPSQEVQPEPGAQGASAGLARLPDGLLGKLRIHKSGKVRMEIGGVPFCVDQGCNTFFQQSLACVCPLAGEIVDLGPIHKRMVVTPDVDQLLAAEPTKRAQGAAGSSREGQGG